MTNLILNFIRGLFGGKDSPGAVLFETILMFSFLPVTALIFLLLYKNIKKLKADETADDPERNGTEPADTELFRAVKAQIHSQRIKLTLYSLIVGCAFFSILAVFIGKLMEYLNAVGAISFDADSPFIRLLTLTLVAPLMIAVIIWAVRTFRSNAGKPEKENKQYVRYSIYAILVCTLVLSAGIVLLTQSL